MYNYTTFGGVDLPNNLVVDQSPAGAVTSYIITTAGGFDTLLGQPTLRKYPFDMTLSGTYLFSTFADFRATMDALRTAIGRRNPLKRVAIDDVDEAHVADARLVDLNYRSRHFNRLHVDVSLKLSVETVFYGSGYSRWFESTLLTNLNSNNTPLGTHVEASFSAGVALVTYANGGGLPVTDPVVKVVVGGGDTLGTCTISNDYDGYSIQLPIRTPPLGVGESLTFDCGAKRVLLNNTVDISNELRLNSPAHIIGPWMYLPKTPGRTIRVATAGLGGNSHVELSFVEQWA